ELRVPPATSKDSRQPTCQSFEQRIRARVVMARREEDVLPPQELGERLGRERWDDANAPKRLLGVSRKGQLTRVEVETLGEPRQHIGALARIVRPARRGNAQPPSSERGALAWWIEDRRIDGVVDHNRVAHLKAQLAVLLEAVAGLQDGGVRNRVDL